MKLIRSFEYALNGLKACLCSELNFRIHLVFAAISILLGIIFQIPVLQWVFLLFSISFVITMEMLNTAVEKLCNFVTEEIHPAIKVIKDISAGAVLVAAALSLLTGLLIFIPAFINYLRS